MRPSILSCSKSPCSGAYRLEVILDKRLAGESLHGYARLANTNILLKCAISVCDCLYIIILYVNLVWFLSSETIRQILITYIRHILSLFCGYAYSRDLKIKGQVWHILISRLKVTKTPEKVLSDTEED